MIVGLKRDDSPLKQLTEKTLGKLNIARGNLASVMGRHIARAIECKIVADRGDIFHGSVAESRKQRRIRYTLTGSAHDLSVSSKEVASTSNHQASAVKEVVSTIEDSDKLSRSVAGRIGEVVHIAEQTRKNVENGFSITRGNLEKMEEIRMANSDVIHGIKALGSHIKSIWEIVEIINAVADQTKIIAFNAEREASAAGEAGKNFEIVANEIRRLASNTMTSTREIKDRIIEIQHASDDLIAVSEAGTLKITEGWQLSKSLDAVFQEVLNSSETSADSARKISESINQQAEAFGQILLTLKQISDGIDNCVMSTEATTQASETLKQMAEDLKAIVEKYGV